MNILTALAASDLSRLDALIEQGIDWCVSAGRQVIIALIILMVGRLIVKLLNRLVAKMLSQRHIDVGVQSFLKSLVNILLTVLLIVSVIGALGVNTTSFAALLASAGVAVGMALSGNLQNFAGGLVILLFKPYRVGDWIEAQGVQGTVREIQIFHTLLTMSDNRTVFVPNGAMSTSVIINYTRNATRRVEWTVGIDYGESVDKAREVIAQVLARDARVLSEPAPFIAVGALADSSVNIVVRVWTKTENYWAVYHETLAAIYEAFNGAQINFPYPQQTVHVVKD